MTSEAVVRFWTKVWCEWTYNLKKRITQTYSLDKWCRFISLHSSPLSITVIPRNHARGNQWRALKGAKRKANWFVTSGLEEQHSGRASYVSSNQPKKWPSPALHDSWPRDRRWPMEATSFYRFNRSLSNVTGRAQHHWRKGSIGISAEKWPGKVLSFQPGLNLLSPPGDLTWGSWVAPAKWVPLQQAA